MIGRIKQVVKILLGRATAGRSVDVFSDDVFIVSYPKSGNTWVRFLIGNLIYQDEPVTFANLERKVPDVYQNSKKELQAIPRPRLLKSHEYFDARYERVIYIVRDPRDVALSYYHHHLKVRTIRDGYPLDRYVGRFIAGKLDPFWSWGDNVHSWLEARGGHDGFLLLRYEDVLEDPLHELKEIADFLILKVTPEQLARAVQLSSADRMRDLEKEQSCLWKTTMRSRKDIPFVRLATSGRWKVDLPRDLAEKIESAWAPIMKTLGYDVASDLRRLPPEGLSVGCPTASTQGLEKSFQWKG